MIKFRDFLKDELTSLVEQAIAMKDDWEEGLTQISSISKTVTDLKWIFLDNIKISKINREFEFRQLRNSLEFVLGYLDTETLETKLGKETKDVFEVIFKISLTRYKSVESKMGYKRLVNVDGVAVLEKYTGNSIATTIYKYLVNKQGYTILGDEKQYFGARKLWANLSKELDLEVDIIDIKDKKIIQSNVILHHGSFDEDFDKALWSYKDDKKYLRSVLKKVLN